MPIKRPWYLNLCRACGQDFSSTTSFDAHRCGKHEYTLLEGLRRDPPVEDGRRCRSVEEMIELGWRLDEQGRWNSEGPMSEEARKALEENRRRKPRSGGTTRPRRAGTAEAGSDKGQGSEALRSATAPRRRTKHGSAGGDADGGGDAAKGGSRRRNRRRSDGAGGS